MPEPTVINCTTGTCTVALSIAPAPTDPEFVADSSALWGLFFVVCIVVYCLKKLLAIFESTPHES